MLFGASSTGKELRTRSLIILLFVVAYSSSLQPSIVSLHVQFCPYDIFCRLRNVGPALPTTTVEPVAAGATQATRAELVHVFVAHLSSEEVGLRGGLLGFL